MSLEALRNQIDGIDEQIIDLLAKRLKIVVEIGEFKHAHDLAVRDEGRFEALLDKLIAKAADSDVPAELVKAVYHEIHEAAIARQEADKLK